MHYPSHTIPLSSNCLQIPLILKKLLTANKSDLSLSQEIAISRTIEIFVFIIDYSYILPKKERSRKKIILDRPH